MNALHKRQYKVEYRWAVAEYMLPFMRKKLVQYGAGNIGRGFIGELFARSGYEVVFVDVRNDIVELFNRNRTYPLNFVSDEDSREIIITGVRAVNGQESGTVADEIASADIIATAVGVAALPHIVEPVARGLKRRWRSGNNTPIDIILCENKLDADKYLRELFLREFSDEECAQFNKTVGLVEASIGRMVPVMTPEMQKGNPLRVCVENYAELPVDGDALKGGVPHIPGLIPASPFSFYIRRKLFIHNMGHALIAYFGFLNRETSISQAVRNPYIRLLAEGAMRQSARSLSKEYGIDLGLILDHVADLVLRFHNRALGDTTERVGSDPIRKLSGTDRLAGAAIFCCEQGLPGAYIHAGIAAGLLYENPRDEASLRLQEIMDKKGVLHILDEICGIAPDSVVGSQVILFYNLLKTNKDFAEVLHKADRLSNEAR